MNRERWHRLMDQFQMPANDRVFELLVSAYSEKHRYYHNQSHIDAVLLHLDTVQDLTYFEQEIELALWFHDAIYNPFSSNNEVESANWARNFLLENNIAQDQAKRVHRLIMATLHTDHNGTSDENLMVDIDLTILGSAVHIYDEFEKNIRKEYQFVPFFLYRKKRKEILQSFLNRESIFKTDYFYSRLEKKARENLLRAIGSL